MKSIKHAVAALLLAGCAATGAFAAPIYDYVDTVFVPADDSGPGTLQSWLFGAGDPGFLAGQTFSFSFLFNTPPSAPSTWFGFHVDGGRQVAFGDAGFYAMGNPLTTPPGYQSWFTATRADGFGFLDSGVVDLVLTGVFLVDGASFLGSAVDDVAAVPEPMTAGLVAAGIAGLLAARRRRRA